MANTLKFLKSAGEIMRKECLLNHLESLLNTIPNGEIWKDIIGYEGAYQVSNFGRVKSLSRNTFDGRKVNGKIMTLCEDSDGYLLAHLRKENISFNAKVHRLVALAFINNKYGKPEVNHIDGDKRNNHIDNLEWVTCSENLKHSFRVLHRKHNRILKDKTGDLHPTSKPVLQFDLNGNFIKRHGSARQASIYIGLYDTAIASAINKNRNIIYGYLWKYEYE